MVLETKLMIDMRMGLGSDDAVGLPFVGCGKTQSCFQGTHGRAEVQQMIEYHRTVVSSTASSRFQEFHSLLLLRIAVNLIA